VSAGRFHEFDESGERLRSIFRSLISCTGFFSANDNPDSHLNHDHAVCLHCRYSDDSVPFDDWLMDMRTAVNTAASGLLAGGRAAVS